MVKTTGIINIKIDDIKAELRTYPLSNTEVEALAGVLFRSLQNTNDERLTQSTSDFVRVQMKTLGYKQTTPPRITDFPVCFME